MLRALSIALLLFLGIAQTGCEEGLEDLVNDDSLTNEEVVAGLKEALKVGTDSTVVQLNAVDGYFKNELIKIFIPPEAQNAAEFVQNNVPGGEQIVADILVKMNRAAEEAASEAKPIFFDAITGITIQDGFNILNGADTAATGYLRVNTNSELMAAYTPKVENAMSSVGLQQAWTEFANIYNNFPTTFNPIPEDISAYVTAEALDGLFIVVGQKETDIRNNVQARVTDILEKVFGSLD